MPELAHMLHGDLLFPNIGVSHCLSYNGKTQPGGALSEFVEAVHMGYRAMCVLLLNYTIRGLKSHSLLLRYPAHIGVL